MWLRAFAVWVVIIGVEFVHGVLRIKFLAPEIGDFRARQVSVFTGALLILGITWLFIRWMRAETTRSLVSVGVGWLVLTVLFEIGLGRLVLGYSWERIFSDYDLTKGGLMSIGLAFLTFTPLLAARLNNVGPAEARNRGTPDQAAKP